MSVKPRQVDMLKNDEVSHLVHGVNLIVARQI